MGGQWTTYPSHKCLAARDQGDSGGRGRPRIFHAAAVGRERPGLASFSACIGGAIGTGHPLSVLQPRERTSPGSGPLPLVERSAPLTQRYSSLTCRLV